MPLQRVFSDGSWKLLRVSSSALAKECCCTPPPACCLYPWEAAFNGLYPDSDLPATLTMTISVDVVTLTKGSGYSYSGIYMGAAVTITLGIDAWELAIDGHPDFPGYSECLIGSYGDSTEANVEDEFQDTYTGKYGVFDEVTLERVNLCEWRGEQEVEGTSYVYRVRYNPDSSSYKWNVQIEGPGGIIGDWMKDDPQSSPEGDYDGIFTVSP